MASLTDKQEYIYGVNNVVIFYEPLVKSPTKQVVPPYTEVPVFSLCQTNFPEHAPRETLLPFCLRGFLFGRNLFMCMNLLNDTKGYFKMTQQEKETLQMKLFLELLVNTYQLPMEKDDVKKHLNKLESKAVINEHYEVAELIKIVHNELKEMDYGYGL
jgi:hypothetical protein